MSFDTAILLVALILGFGLISLLVLRELRKVSQPRDDRVISDWLRTMQSSMEHQSMHVASRLDAAAKLMGDVKQELGEMSEVGKGIRSLQEFLQSPKLRGNIGEQVLGDMIGQSFPKRSFHLQYSFKSGVKVDAVLKTDAGLLCIDSKFPMQNFTKMHTAETETERKIAHHDFIADVKKHIFDISKKYILPDEGTTDFALMYIPSEAVYYDVVNSEELMNSARKERVYPVSPNTLYAHLQVLLLSFQGHEMEQKTRQVFQLLRAAAKDYERVEEQMGVLSRHIGNAFNAMSTVSGSFSVLGQKLTKSSLLPDASEEV